MRSLLNVAGQSFIISGFVLFVLLVPLYLVYPPLYMGMEEHAVSLLFFSKLGFFWTFAGICPIILSMVLKEISVGDLVVYGPARPRTPGLVPDGPGIVVDRLDDVPIGWWREEEREATEARYRIYWQDQKTASWYWESSISRYEEISRSDEQEAQY